MALVLCNLAPSLNPLKCGPGTITKALVPWCESDHQGVVETLENKAKDPGTMGGSRVVWTVSQWSLAVAGGSGGYVVAPYHPGPTRARVKRLVDEQGGGGDH